MRAAAEAEVKVVPLQLQGVRQLNVLQRPTARPGFLIFRAVVHPDAQVALRLAPHLERIDIAAVELAWPPLERREAADDRIDAAEALRTVVSDGERGDAAGRLPLNRAAVRIFANVVFRVH